MGKERRDEKPQCTIANMCHRLIGKLLEQDFGELMFS
jgi:hypothetical protein